MPRPAKQDPVKYCETCVARLLRKHNAAGRLEDFRTFTRRRFCSLSCANSRPKGGTSRNAYLYRARKMLGPACECCGTKKRLHAHHINMDWTNNAPSNLQTLCVFCHQFWHSTHIRLGVKPTGPMPRLFTRSEETYPAAWDDCAVTETRSIRSKRQSSSRR